MEVVVVVSNAVCLSDFLHRLVLSIVDHKNAD
jgi:hypothetical protein